MMRGIHCATCRVPGAAATSAATIQELGALLAGDWPVVEAGAPRQLTEASGLVAAYLQWHLERGLKSLAHVERRHVDRDGVDRAGVDRHSVDRRGVGA